MIRLKGTYRNQTLELERPLPFSDGGVLEVDIRSPEDELREGWSHLRMERLGQDWDNEKDAVYDKGPSVGSAPSLIDHLHSACTASRRSLASHEQSG
jgi:hypothetical protein